MRKLKSDSSSDYEPSSENSGLEINGSPQDDSEFSEERPAKRKKLNGKLKKLSEGNLKVYAHIINLALGKSHAYTQLAMSREVFNSEVANGTVGISIKRLEEVGLIEKDTSTSPYRYNLLEPTEENRYLIDDEIVKISVLEEALKQGKYEVIKQSRQTKLETAQPVTQSSDPVSDRSVAKFQFFPPKTSANSSKISEASIAYDQALVRFNRFLKLGKEEKIERRYVYAFAEQKTQEHRMLRPAFVRLYEAIRLNNLEAHVYLEKIKCNEFPRLKKYYNQYIEKSKDKAFSTDPGTVESDNHSLLELHSSK